ncbi:hypothetical protein [Nocardiopsis aegyptia]|uniref:Uncharacterized protein n=1 Tax=Nocardiopsis aegyptia TaxID=220378 RepID=A0A7Z0JCB9_9ACTN|nr:hypothetical protein [Nocardiopsis aegyptia]NYJ37066.1 hypothetical protein [Nocardiopsis aegyptia]
MASGTTHQVDILLFAGADLLDAVGPAEVFTMANYLITPSHPHDEMRYLAEGVTGSLAWRSHRSASRPP